MCTILICQFEEKKNQKYLPAYKYNFQISKIGKNMTIQIISSKIDE